MAEHRGPMETQGGKERAAALARLRVLWTSNLGAQVWVWPQPAPESVGRAWHSLARLVGVGLQ